RARRGVDLLAVELEAGPAGVDEVELLVLALLVVLVQDAVAGLVAGPRVDAEGRDVEVVADGSPGLAAVGDLGDLVDMRQGVSAAHWGPPAGRVSGPEERVDGSEPAAVMRRSPGRPSPRRRASPPRGTRRRRSCAETARPAPVRRASRRAAP